MTLAFLILFGLLTILIPLSKWRVLDCFLERATKSDLLVDDLIALAMFPAYYVALAESVTLFVQFLVLWAA